MPRVLDNWLRAFAQYSAYSEAPDIMNFWTGVSTIAGALRRRVWIDQLKFKWYPNFYIVFVGPPGIVAKSTTSAVGMNLLRQVDGVFMGPSSMTWQGLTFALSNACQLVPMPSEKVDKDYIPMSCITCEVSELGTFLDPSNQELVSVLIDLWDGKDAKWERWLRSKEDTVIENPWINLIAATTPSWLRANFPEEMIGGGLTSRMIFVFADKKKQFIPYVSELVHPDEYRELEEMLVHDLNEIANMFGAFKLSKEAIEFGSEWYVKHWQNPDEHLKEPRFEGYRARKQSHVHKLAMILSASESDELIITKEHLEMAIAFVTAVEYDMHIVFDSIGNNVSGKYIDEMLNIVKVHKSIPRQELWKLLMRIMTPKEFTETTDALVAANYIQIIPYEGQIRYVYVDNGRRKREEFNS